MDAAHARRPITTIVHGCAPGADTLADEWAAANCVRVDQFPAAWKTLGPAAGPIRNQQMVDAGADGVIAFPGGRGTADCVRRAEGAGIAAWRPFGPGFDE